MRVGGLRAAGWHWLLRPRRVGDGGSGADRRGGRAHALGRHPRRRRRVEHQNRHLLRGGRPAVGDDPLRTEHRRERASRRARGPRRGLAARRSPPLAVAIGPRHGLWSAPVSWWRRSTTAWLRRIRGRTRSSMRSAPCATCGPTRATSASTPTGSPLWGRAPEANWSACSAPPGPRPLWNAGPYPDESSAVDAVVDEFGPADLDATDWPPGSVAMIRRVFGAAPGTDEPGPDASQPDHARRSGRPAVPDRAGHR